MPIVTRVNGCHCYSEVKPGWRNRLTRWPQKPLSERTCGFESRSGHFVSNWGADGWAIRPGEGLTIDTRGPHQPEILVRGAQVDHALGAFVFTHGVIPENPPHAHLDFMKIAYVLEGEYEFRVGEAEFTAGPGTLVVVPKGSQHTFTTATGGQMLFVCSPSGNEELFVEMGQLGPAATQEQLAELNARFRTVSLPGAAGAPWRRMFKKS